MTNSRYFRYVIKLVLRASFVCLTFLLSGAIANLLAGENRIAVDTSTASSQGPAFSSLGSQNIVTILVNFKTYKLEPYINQDFVRGMKLGNAFAPSSQSQPDYSLDDFWRQNSDDKIWVNPALPTVLGPFDLPGDYNTSGPCEGLDIANAAIAAADSSVNFEDYSQVVIVMAQNGGCPGMASGPLPWNSPSHGTFTASVAWTPSNVMSTRLFGVRQEMDRPGIGSLPEADGPLIASSVQREHQPLLARQIHGPAAFSIPGGNKKSYDERAGPESCRFTTIFINISFQ